MGLIVVSIVFQFHLGPIFTYAMIAFACGYILYDTSNGLRHYRIGQHVAAALALFRRRWRCSGTSCGCSCRGGIRAAGRSRLPDGTWLGIRMRQVGCRRCPRRPLSSR